jgi:hypothetical protein
VYDLGGGTFDAAVLRKEGDGFQILGTPEGIEQLGGVDFDEAVFRHVVAALGDALSSLDPEDPNARMAVARLRRDCVEAKEALSGDTVAIVPVVLPGVSTGVRLVRSEFEAVIQPTIADTIGAMRRALQSAEVDASELSAIVLVGGSSRIPLISQLLVAEFGCPLAIDTHPKHDVALGAALVATPQDQRTVGGESHDVVLTQGGGKAAAPPAPPSPPPVVAAEVPASPPPVVAAEVPASPPPAAAAKTADPPAAAATTADLPAAAAAKTADRSEIKPVAARAVPAPAVSPAGRPVARQSPVAVQPVTDVRRGRSRDWRWPAAAAVAVSLVVGAVALTVMRRGDGSGTETPTQSTTTNNLASSVLPRSAEPLPADRLVWPSERSDNRDIYSIRVSDGSSQVRLTTSPAVDTLPVISRDRRTVIYLHTEGEITTLHVVGADGRDDRQLFRTGAAAGLRIGGDSRPAWSPDGQSIAVAATDEESRSGIFVVSVDGSSVRRLPTKGDHVGDPAWWGDGTSSTILYWEGKQKDGGSLWAVDGANPDGAPVRLSSSPDGSDADPAWSIDGKKIAFRRAASTKDWNIWVMDANGTGAVQLTRAPRRDHDPTWSPDGGQLAFHSDRTGDRELYVMNAADGSHLGRIVRNVGWDSGPSWTPR